MFTIYLKLKQFFCPHTKLYRRWKYHAGWVVTCEKCGKTRIR